MASIKCKIPESLATCRFVMLQWLKHIGFFAVFSNIFISCCAVAFTLTTFRLLSGKLFFSPLLLLIFSGTLFIYILQRMFPGASPDVQNSAMQLWISQYTKILWGLAGIAFFVATGIFLPLPGQEQVLIVIIAIITIAYSFPVLLKFRLRDLGAIKYLFIALVWSLTTVMLPVLHLDHNLMDQAVLFLFAERFLFITAITIPFDIRDVRYDQQSLKNRTLPMTIGIESTKRLAYSVLAAFLMVCLCHQFILGFVGGWPVLIGLFGTVGITYLTIYFTNSTSSEFYYLFYLDGAMILQFLMVEAGFLL